MTKIQAGSAFDPSFKSAVDWSDLSHAQEKRQSATKQREAQQALGRHGTIHGLSPRSDEQIAKIGRMRKSSKLG